MALEQPKNDTGLGLASNNYSESRAPQFVGGSIDPSSGNLIPSSRSQANAAPPPATPTTQLGSIEPPPPAPVKADTTTPLLAAGLTAAGNVLGPTAGGVIGKALGGNTGASGKNPLDIGTPGGSTNSTGAGNYTPTTSPDFSPPPAPTSSGNSGTGPLGAGGYGGDLFAAGKSSSAPVSAPTGAPPLNLSSPNDAAAASGSGLSYAFSPGTGGGGGGNSVGATASAGTVICTELQRQGLLDLPTFEADAEFGRLVRAQAPHVYAGYMLWAPTCVRWMQASPGFSRFVASLALPWADTMAYRVRGYGKSSRLGALVFHIGVPLCAALGRIVGALSQRVTHAAH